MEPHALPRRFYQAVGVEPCETGFVITLDGKRIITPRKKLLQVLLQQTAAAIAEEWRAQKEVINPDTMPLTRLAYIAIDRVPVDRVLLLEDIVRYAETDLLCYRAPASVSVIPAQAGISGKSCASIEGDSRLRGNDNFILRQRQDAVFDPILVWIKQEFGAAFLVTEGIVPVDQPPASLRKAAAVFSAADDHGLAALAMLVPMLGSALLALALWKEKITVEEALVAARLDETVQAERWGEDSLAAAAWVAKVRDIRAAGFYLTGK